MRINELEFADVEFFYIFFLRYLGKQVIVSDIIHMSKFEPRTVAKNSSAAIQVYRALIYD